MDAGGGIKEQEKRATMRWMLRGGNVSESMAA
jgi:hypothetical protein